MACIKRLNITTSEARAPTFVLQPQRDDSPLGIERIYSTNTVGCFQISYFFFSNWQAKVEFDLVFDYKTIIQNGVLYQLL